MIFQRVKWKYTFFIPQNSRISVNKTWFSWLRKKKQYCLATGYQETYDHYYQDLISTLTIHIWPIYLLRKISVLWMKQDVNIFSSSIVFLSSPIQLQKFMRFHLFSYRVTLFFFPTRSMLSKCRRREQKHQSHWIKNSWISFLTSTQKGKKARTTFLVEAICMYVRICGQATKL